MTTFEPADPRFRERVEASFARQSVMALIDARLERVEPGAVEIALPFGTDLTQQHGFVHAGIITTIADSACGYAALSLMPAEAEVLSVEFKINLLRPAAGERFIARGFVIRPGRTVTATRADVIAKKGGESRVIAAMQATMIPSTRSATVERDPDIAPRS